MLIIKSVIFKVHVLHGSGRQWPILFQVGKKNLLLQSLSTTATSSITMETVNLCTEKLFKTKKKPFHSDITITSNIQ